MSIYLDPELCDWLTVEARVQRITMSELVNRLLHQQQTLRQDLATLPEAQGVAPLFSDALRAARREGQPHDGRHGEAIGRSPNVARPA